MTAGRGDDVAPPPGPGEFAIRYATKDAATGWRDLCKQAPGNALLAWEWMRADPAPHPPTDRHHQLKHKLATGVYQGQTLPQWQIEVTRGGRIWYLFDTKKRTCWLKEIHIGHPKATE